MNNNNLKKIEHFRNISIGYYIFSFTIITIFFCFFLISNKKNRSCQYGSTLFCRNDKQYLLSKDTTKNYNSITFSSDPKSGTINFKQNFEINYNIGDPIPSNITNVNNGVGISQRSSGASIYIAASDPTTSILQSVTRYTLLESSIKEDIEILNVANNNSVTTTTLDYFIDPPSSTFPTFTNSIATNTISNFSPADDIYTNWSNLLDPLNNKNGCSINDVSNCACVDPSFVTNKLCTNLIYNYDSGLYCPATSPNCTTACENSSSTDCGFTFCRSGANPDNTKGGYSNITDDGLYLNTTIPLKSGPVALSKYKINNEGIENYLDGTPSTDNLKDYPSVQFISFCGGKSKTNNNYFNESNTKKTNLFSDLDTSNNYTPQFSTQPNFITNSKNFDF